MLVRVQTLEQAEAVRQIRNLCREFMTHDQAIINPEQQVKWFESIQGSEMILPFLFCPPLAGIGIGYGLVRFDTERWWISGGLLPSWRGKGLGTVLFGELADYVNDMNETCWLDVFESNTVAVKTYHKLGFVDDEVRADGYSVVIVMRRAP